MISKVTIVNIFFIFKIKVFIIQRKHNYLIIINNDLIFCYLNINKKIQSVRIIIIYFLYK